MQTRREFLSCTAATLLVLPIGAACGSSSGSAAPSAGPCNGIETTSTVANNHTHTVCTPDSDLASLPAAGVTYVTSVCGPWPHARRDAHASAASDHQRRASGHGHLFGPRPDPQFYHSEDVSPRPRWTRSGKRGNDHLFQDWLGHSTITMTMRYAHLAPGGGSVTSAYTPG
jgi:hypothetical protein